MMPEVCTKKNKRAATFAAGAVIALTGYDTVFPLPRGVHYALAGVATDAYCQSPGYPQLDTELMMCAAGGVLGGIFIRYMSY